MPGVSNPGTTYQNLNGTISSDLANHGIPVCNIQVFYSDSENTNRTYKVTAPTSSLLWRNGIWSGHAQDTVQSSGDDAVPLYSAKAPDLWQNCSLPSDNNLALNSNIQPVKHGNLMVYPHSQQEFGLALTGIMPPFTNPLNALNRYFQAGPSGVFSGLGLSPVELLVTDPLGQRLGYDSTTGQILHEIPTGVYVHPTGEPVEFAIYGPLVGTYTITVAGTGIGPYTLLDLFTDQQASVPIYFEQNTIQPGESHVVTVNVPAHSSDVPVPPEVSAGNDFSGYVGAPTQFNGSVTDTNPNDTYTMQWDFGDGSTASGTLTPTHTYTAPGTYTVTLTVTDSLGFVVSDSLHITVTYQFSGFFAPISNLPMLNVVNAGRAIPVKFSLNGNWGLNIFATGHPASASVTCGSTGNDATEPTLAPGSSGLSYDPTSDQYTYVWKTDKSWANTCRTLVVKLSDGTYHFANFQFK